MGKRSQQLLEEHWLQPPGTLAQEQGWGHEACAHLAAVGKASPQQ